MEEPRARLAPTPSGFLHLGNAANFLLNARLAGLTSTAPAFGRRTSKTFLRSSTGLVLPLLKAPPAQKNSTENGASSTE